MMPYTNLIKALGFAPKENATAIFRKTYANKYSIEIDLDKEKIDYGKLITIGNKKVLNFSPAENWVVLECVDRLLDKGYSPKNIVLEKVYPTGHGTSGDLDILVNHDNRTAYLMIECKTHGSEFEKAAKKLRKDGGQLFTYFQQDKNAAILMLYASHLEGVEVTYKNEIVKIEDDHRLTANVKDFHERWNKLPKTNGVFDSWVNPYDFQSKALTPETLKDITQEDSSLIFNQFLEILRHNVVSDKPNAFNKIFTLFLCKISDEKNSNSSDELKFQWLEGIDDHISFQKRLTDLYKRGMKEFLEKEVTDLSDKEFEEKFGHFIQDEETRTKILDELTKLRLKKNNEFAIKEVFDEDSFQENAKVVKEVVELLQGFKIRYTKKQQYLSDFFELLLTTGLKQESGQFFTPVPIAQFIIKSLPMDKIVRAKLAIGEANDLLPTVIDYAAGSGHFITESMHELQRIIDGTDPKDFIDATSRKIKTWKQDHFDWAFQYVYGIEKDYRLVKVGKVGCYLHGDGLAKIVHSDGLGNFSKTSEYKDLLKKTDKDFPQENKQFDIVISNPPYSVSAFKGTLKDIELSRPAYDGFVYEDQKEKRQIFDLFKYFTDQSSEIECLFIERTKQLLKDGGLAGIILPSSILSNTGIYTKAREIILKYFEIIAIAELGSNTFMATGTNTVTLFLRRRNNYDSINIRKSVENAVADAKDVTINGIENPFAKYVAHVWEGISFADYVTLLKKVPNDEINDHEIYQEYNKKIAAKGEAEKFANIIEIETEKLFYFILAYKQKIVLVKSGEKQAEKQFLGYEFSNRRGSEGIHPIQRGKNIDECTQLFDSEIFDNPEKASTYIYHAFNGDLETPINAKLAENISRVDLVDMFTFDRVSFDKEISLAVKKKIKIKTKWDSTKLEDIAILLKRGKSAKYGNSKIQIIKSGQARGLKEFDFSEKHFVDKNFSLDERQLQKGDILINSSGVGTAGRVTLFDLDGAFVVDSHVTILRPNQELIIPSFVLYSLASIGFENIEEMALGQSGQIELTLNTIKYIKIPLPPKDIQEKIVAEIELLETKEAEANAEIGTFRKEIKELFNTGISKADKVSRLSDNDIYEVSIGKRVLKNELVPNGKVPVYSANVIEPFGYINKLIIDDFVRASVLWGIDGDWMVNYIPKDYPFYPTDHCGVLRVKGNHVDEKYLAFVLEKEGKTLEFSRTKRASIDRIEGIRIPLPPIQEQRTMISQITEIEKRIAVLENEMEPIPLQKEAILKKYL